MNQRRQWTHRVRNMIAVVLVACGLMAVTATVASADTACSAGPSHVICFDITPAGGDLYDVHVGIDITMSRSEAERILAQSGDPVDAWIMGDDPFRDDALFRVILTWIAAGDHGLSAEFDIRVPDAAFDEDPDGDDELYARVRLFDNLNPTRTFRSPTVTIPDSA